MFEFANFLLLALFAAAAFDAVTALAAAPDRGFGRIRAAFLDRWRREHFLFGGWGTAWRERLGTVLFAAGLASYEFTVTFCNSMARVRWSWVQGNLSPVLDWVTFLCFGAKILLGTRYTWRSLGMAGCLYFIGRWTYFNSQNIWWIGIILAVMAAKGTALKKPLRTYFAAGLAGILLTVSLYFAGLIPAGSGGERVGEIRGTFGYGHPNTFGGLVFGLTMAYAMLRAGKMRWRDIALIAASGVFLWVGPASRSASLCALLLAAVLAVHKLRPRLLAGRAVPGLSVAFVALLAAVSFVLPLFLVKTGPWNSDFGPGWIAAIDGALTNRLSLTWSAYWLLDIKIAGQVLDPWPPLDNSFAFALYQFGPVVLAILLILLATALWGLAKTRRWTEFLCLAVMLVYAYMECQPFHLTTNPTALLLCGVVYCLPAAVWPRLDAAPPEHGTVEENAA